MLLEMNVKLRRGHFDLSTQLSKLTALNAFRKITACHQFLSNVAIINTQGFNKCRVSYRKPCIPNILTSLAQNF